MTETSDNPLERVTSDEDAKRALDEAAEKAQRPHHDEAARREQQESAERAGENPRRES